MTMKIIASALPCLDFQELPTDPQARKWLEDLRGPNGPRWIWVVPSARRKRALLRHWPGTEKGKASLLPRIVTLEGLTDLIAAYIGTRGKRITSLERRLRVLRAWQEVNPELSAGLGTAMQVDQLLRSYQESQATPLEATDKSFLHLYHEGLRRSNSLDRNGLWQRVTEELQTVSSTTWGRFPFEGILIDGFHRFGIPEGRFLQALAKRLPVRVWAPCCNGGSSGELLNRLCFLMGEITPQLVDEPNPGPLAAWAIQMLGHESLEELPPVPDDGSLTRLDLKDSTAEVREVIRRIRLRLLEKDAPKPHEIAIIVPGPQYDSSLRQGFLNAGITFNIAGQSRILAHSAPARLVHAALHLVEGGDSLRALMDFLRLPIIKDHLLGESAMWLAWLETNLKDLPKPDHFENWSSLLVSLRDRLRSQKEIAPLEEDEVQSGEVEEQTRARHQSRIALVEKTIEGIALLQPLSKSHETMESCLNGIGNLLARLKVPQWTSPGDQRFEKIDPTVWQDEQLAWERLKAVLNRLRDIPDSALPLNRLGQPDPLHVVLLALESESYQIKTEDDEGVQILEIRETRGLHFREVHVLGLKSGAYDAQSEEEILRRLLAEQRQARAFELQEARQMFFQLGLVARDRLTLYRPRFVDEEALLPSVWLEGIPPAESAIGNPLIGEQELLVELGWMKPLNQEGPWTVDPHADEQALVIANKVANLRETSYSWWQGLKSPAIEPWALDLIPHRHDLNKPFSPSRIEAFSRCPFRFFTESVLGLRERDTDETALIRGSLIHKLFQRYINHCREAKGLDKNQPMSLGYPRTEARNKLVQMWASVLRDFPEEARLIDERVRAIVVGHGGAIDLYLDNLERFQSEGISHIASEYAVGPKAIDSGDEPVLISGRIDDWFQRSDGRAVLVDYKTGTAPGQKDFFDEHANHLRIQLDLYAAALNLTVAQGLYIFLQVNKQPEEKDHLKNLTRIQGEMVRDWAGLPRGVKTPAAIDVDSAREHAIATAKAVRSGAFPLTTINDGDECSSHCSGKTICRTLYSTTAKF